MPVTGEELRDLMRSIPTSVVVVAAMSEEGARGMTAGSFASVSLDPPLVCFNVMRASRVHTVFLQASRFVISILSDRQAEIAIRFARSGLGAREQFHGVPHRLDPEGNPMLDGAIGCSGQPEVAVKQQGGADRGARVEAGVGVQPAAQPQRPGEAKGQARPVQLDAHGRPRPYVPRLRPPTPG